MELINSRDIKKFLPNDSPQEIDERLRRRYLDRLSIRVKRLRKFLVERNWENLRLECSQLAASGETFGFENLTHLAIVAQNAIPSGRVPRAFTPIHAKPTTDALIAAIDTVLIDRT